MWINSEDECKEGRGNPIMRKRIGYRRTAGGHAKRADFMGPIYKSNIKQIGDDMTTTYYLLRTKESAIGNGPYIGHNACGDLALIVSHLNALRFNSLEAAEQYSIQIREQFGMFEREVRNSAA